MAKHRILPFPDANVGEVLGLVEIIYAYGGKSKISFIAEELRMELDDLGDVVDMAELLGLVKVKNGIIQLSVYGEALNLGTIEDKKRILRKQLLNLEPFKTVVALIKKEVEVDEREIVNHLKVNHIIDDLSRFHKLFLSWGGYAEIIEYDGKKQRFRIPKPQEIEQNTDEENGEE